MSESFAFAHPWALALLVLLPLYALWRRRQQRRAAVAFAPLQLAAPAPARARSRWRHGLLPLELALLAAALLGVAGPHREQRLELLEDEGVDVVLALDVSLSMLAEDFRPNRLAALRRLAGDFVGRAGGNRLALVVFAGDSYVQSPLTTDHGALAELLDGVTAYTLNPSKSAGTAIGDALLVAGERLAAGRIEGREQAVVLITDGESNTGVEPLLAARYLAASAVRLYAIGIGGTEPVQVRFEGEPVGGGESPYLAALDSAQLEAVAEAAGGRFFRATDAGALEAVLAEISRLESAPLEQRTLAVRSGFARWLALAALPLYSAYLLLAAFVLRRPLR
jgi:Ca-activated chloride channel family protein